MAFLWDFLVATFMGCATSVRQTAPVRRPRPQPVIDFFYDDTNPPPPPEAVPLPEQLRIDSYKILSSLSQIYAPERVMPVVCLADYAFPLFLCPFSVEDQANEIILPICALSRFDEGRFVYIGSTDFLLHSVISHTETMAFIENIVNWCADYKAQTVKVLLLGWQATHLSSIRTHFASYGYVVDDKKEFPQTLRGYSVIFITTSYNLTEDQAEQIIGYVKSGGACVCFASVSELNLETDHGFRLNSLLDISGLAFAMCSLGSGSEELIVCQNEELEKYTFEGVYKRFIELTSVADIGQVDLQDLDNAVSELKYYVTEITESRAEIAVDLYEKTWAFLNRTGFQDDTGICPDVRHSVFAVLLTELMPRIPANRVSACDLATHFPGLAAASEKVVQTKMRLSMRADAVTCTGLWLQAGQTATILADFPVTVQIGAHGMCMLLKPGPWKRWPTVVSRWAIDGKVETEIASPFGGLVYLTSRVTRMIQFSISGIVRAPMIVYNRKETWEETKDLDVPWGDVRTQALILTMPSKSMRMIEDPDKFCNLLDIAIQNLLRCLGVQLADPRHIVFDIDLPASEPVVMDAIYMHVGALPGIVYVKHPGLDLFDLLKTVGFSIIGGAFFDREIELTISSVAACYAISVAWPDVDPLDCIAGGPSRFIAELWQICKDKGPVPFASTMQGLMTNQEISTPHDAWIFFVKTLSQKVGQALPQLIDKFSQSGKLAPISSDRLQAYQIDSSSDVNV